MISANKLVNKFIEVLNKRQKEIILKRFGLDSEQKTLSSLGKQFGVTRERVRQIQNNALKLIKEKNQNNLDYKNLINKIEKILKNNGGLARVDKILEELKPEVSNLNENNLSFFLVFYPKIKFYEENNDFYPFYFLEDVNLKNVFGFVNKWINLLKSKKQEVLDGKYHKLFEEFIKKEKILKNQAISFISISKKIKVNSYGDIGLSDWPEINPRVIRDKIYLVLKKEKKPVHFKHISKKIYENRLSEKLIGTPTIHNELIKDKRFVLVGRGIYALKEWGHEPGTVKDIIIKLLKKEGPMRSRAIVLAIQKDKFFKQNTILANLQNKNYFERLADGTYKIKQA
ncbi:MAG: sigma factor-like helix-turn-helix DNA-binding protein [Minisyncoccia bacterium]